MNLALKTTALSIGLWLSACATQPITIEVAKSVPVSRVYNQGLLSDAPNLLIKRDTGFLGGGCSISVFVDRQLIATIHAGEKLPIALSSGDHFLGAKPDGMCAGGLVETSVRIDLAPKTFRLSVTEGQILLQPTAF